MRIFRTTVETYTDKYGSSAKTITHPADIFRDEYTNIDSLNGWSLDAVNSVSDIFGNRATHIENGEDGELSSLLINLLLDTKEKSNKK